MSTNTFTSEPIASQGQQVSAQSIPVVLASDQSPIPVTGTVTEINPSVGTTGATVPASATYVAGKNVGNLVGLAVDGSGNIVVSSIVAALPAGSNAIGTVTVGNASLAVTGTFWQATQPVSAASLPLPTSASTSAKQPALGTAGTASSDVLTVQGIASMTALKIDGSAVTQPVSGTVTATNIANGTTGATAPGAATQVGGVNSGNLIALAVDNSGRPIVVGAGTAGSASGGVLTVQGSASGTPIPISGSITATNAAVGTIGSAAPTSASYGGLLNGSNLIGALGDSSGRTVVAGGGTAGSAAGGVLSVQGVASMTALKVDGSAVTQPVSGNLTTVSTVTTVTAVTAITNALPVGTNALGTVGLTTTAAVFQAEGNLAFGSITTSYQTVLTPSASTKLIQLRNNTNGTMQVSFDAGTTIHYVMDSGDAVSLDFLTNTLTAPTTAIQIKYTGSAPTTGSFRANAAH